MTWDNPADVEVYIDKLQKSAERITTENRKLRKIHSNIATKVGQLLGTDLLRNQEKWKEGVRDIRGIMDTLEAQGYKSIFFNLIFALLLIKCEFHNEVVRMTCERYESMADPLGLPTLQST